MPLYEYECDACAHRFERIQKYSDPLVDTCPKCGGHVRKLLSSPAIQFKGSGFYINDYAKSSSSSSDAGKGGSKSDTKPSDSSTSSSDSSSSGTAAKTESKSESKTESK